METLKAIFTGIKKNISKSKENPKKPITVFADSDYDFGLDVCQKLLFVLCVIPFLSNSWEEDMDMLIMWPLCCSIVGFCILYFPFKKIFKKKTQEIQSKEKAMRFLCIPDRIWSWVVLLFLLVVFVSYMFIGEFDAINLVVYPFQIFIIHAILTKNVSLAYKRSEHAHDPNVRGTKEWVKANGVEKVYGVGSDFIYRDKHGNYYDHGSGGYLPIPAPVTIKKDK